MKALNRIVENARLAPMRIVLCEADDARVLAAAARANQEGIARILLVGDPGAIRAAAARESVDLGEITLIDPQDSAWRAAFADELVTLRRARA